VYSGSSDLELVKGQASAECTDTVNSGCNDPLVKFAEMIAHFILHPLAVRVKGKGCWRLGFNEEDGVLVQLNCERLDNTIVAGGRWRNVTLS
jgi:hypothetical protein